MNASDLRGKSVDELAQQLEENLKEQFALRMQQGSGQLERPSEMKRVRRNIARLKTLIAEAKQEG